MSNNVIEVVASDPVQVITIQVPTPGPTGPQGPANLLTIGTVVTLPPGSNAAASITGDSPSQVLNLSLPRGAGLILGGTAEQVLVKGSSTDYDVKWETATDASTANALVRRDASGGATFGYISAGSATVGATPVNANDVTRKDYVDAADTALSGRVTATENTLTAATSASTASAIVKRDASGRAKVVDPAAATDIATKNYVDNEDAAYRRVPTNSQASTAYTFALADEGKVVYYNTDSSPVAYTIPTNATVAFPVGAWIDVYAGASGAVTIQGAAGVTLRGPDGQATVTLRAIYSKVRITKSNTDTWQVVGDANNAVTNAVTAAASAPTVNTIIKRDVNGRAQVVDPSASADIATKNYTDTQNVAMRRAAVQVKTAAYTLALTDERTLIQMNSATPVGLTVPANATVAFPIGTVIEVEMTGAGQVSIVPGSGAVTLSGYSATYPMTLQYSIMTLVKVGTDAWVLKGWMETNAGSSPNQNTLVVRDNAGRAQVVDPAVAADIATKNYVDLGNLNAAKRPQQSWTSANTNAAPAGWYKIGTATLTAQYADINLALLLESVGHGTASMQQARVVMRVKQDAAMGTAPNTSVSVSDVLAAAGTTFTAAQFMTIIESNTAGSSVVSLWMQNNLNYSVMIGYEEFNSNPGAWAYVSGSSPAVAVGSLPAGTETVGVLAPTDLSVATATSASTASTLVKRDASDSFGVANVNLDNAPSQVYHATRKDYVDNSKRIIFSQSDKAASYTFTLADEGTLVRANSTTPLTYYLPFNSNTPFAVGAWIDVANWNTGTLTIHSNSGVTLVCNGAMQSPGSGSITLQQYESVRLLQVATDTWLAEQLATSQVHSGQLTGGNVTVSLAASTWTLIQGQLNQTSGMRGSVTADTSLSKLIVGVAGTYAVGGVFSFSGGGAGVRRQGSIYKNGAILTQSTAAYPINSVQPIYALPTFLVDCVPGDYFQLAAWHDNTAAWNFAVGNSAFNIQRVG